MDPDDIDDPLDDRRADLEARFRELEQQQEIERMRHDLGRSGGAPPRGEGGGRGAAPKGATTPPGGRGHTERSADELADMKAVLDDEAELERYVLLLCPHCGAKNRTSLTRVRAQLPRCGGCKQPLSFTRL